MYIPEFNRIEDQATAVGFHARQSIRHSGLESMMTLRSPPIFRYLFLRPASTLVVRAHVAKGQSALENDRASGIAR